ncbi:MULTISPECIES: SflA family class IV lanthipeptide [Kitasatospora]|uniref:SflA family class IV lanthipeptide n=1 Tax=Kitasatospora TaxID=2063 RepID=UPI000CA80376|nr:MULTISPECIES: SflA family class IV lanthipeptide [Kitasatospora]MDH6143677.1 hypothetical protein [Kitasatospora sp. GP30]
MTTLALDIRDAGMLDIDDEVIAFEDDFDAELAPAACWRGPLTFIPVHVPGDDTV